MQIYPFDREQAKIVDQHDSHGAAMGILRSIRNAHIGVMYIASSGVVGYHPAVGDQL